MKKFLFSLILLLVSYVGFSQKGLSYQAVILDPNKIEVPGQDISGQPLVNGEVWMKFSIYNGSALQFEEVQKTQTDAYGLVNLLIGSVSATSFNSLVWDSSQKSLQVFVSFNQGGSYTQISDQKLTYNPYALFAETAGKLSGVLPVANGGTGATTSTSARSNLGLGNVENTADLDKPISSATQSSLNLKANASELVALTSTVASNTARITTNESDIALKAPIASPTFTGTVSGITKSMVGLGSVDNTTDAAKPISTATQAALDLKANSADLTSLTTTVNANTASITANTSNILLKANTTDVNTALALKANAADLTSLTTNVNSNTASITANTSDILLKANTTDVNTSLALKAPIASPTFTGTVSGITKSMVGLGSVDNTTDAAKPISTATQTALDLKANAADLTTLTNSVNANTASITAKASDIALKANTTDVNTALALKANSADITTLTTTVNSNTASITANTSDIALKAPIASPTFTGTVSGITKSMVGLGSVDNTTDAAKPISTATQTALDLKANAADLTTLTNSVNSNTASIIATATDLATLTTAVNANTASITANTSDIALKANTTDVTTALALKADLESPALSGVPTAPTASAGTNTTQVATTAFVQSSVISNTLSLGAVNELATTQGATIVSNVLKLSPANETNSGLVNTSNQTFAGGKTFKDGARKQITATTANVDQSYITSGPQLGSAIPQWQSFTAGITGILSSVEWQMANFNSVAANVTLNLYEGEGVNGTLLATSSQLVSPSTNPSGYINFPLTNVVVQAGSKYTMKVTPSLTIRLGIQPGGSYSGGKTGLTGTLANADFLFNTNVKAITSESFITASEITKSMVGLGSVDNTPDAAKPISTATQAALDLKAPLESPTFTGSPNLPTGTTGVTQTSGDNSTKLATTAFVASAVSAMSGNSGVPYTGATGAVNLGAYDLTVNGLTIGKGNGSTLSNTAIGLGALTSNTQGSDNTSNGYNSLNKNTDGFANSAFGSVSLFNNLEGGYNSSFGSSSLYYNTSGNFNSSFGSNALYKNTIGSENTASGFNALSNNTVGSYNSATGVYALAKNTLGEENTANGVGSLVENTEGNKNTAIGRFSLKTNILGNRNTAIGFDADVATESLENATAVGNGAVVEQSNTIQLGNNDVTNVNTRKAITVDGIRISRGGAQEAWSTAIGYEALINNNGGYSNTAFGYTALKNNVNGGHNSAFGPEALLNNTDGARNTAIGRGTLIQNSTGNENTALGNEALNSQSSGDGNTAIGHQAGTGSEYSTYGTFLGYRAGQQGGQTLTNATAIGYNAEVTESNTIQLGNNDVTNVNTRKAITVDGIRISRGGAQEAWSTAIGYEALITNTGGGSNTAFGYTALKNNVNGSGNSAFGPEALHNNTSGERNIAIGNATLHENSTGSYNTVVGSSAAYNLTGSWNTAVGNEALNSQTSGGGNTAIGHQAGSGNSTYGTFLGYGAIPSGQNLTNATAIGYNAVVTTDHTIQLGNTQVTNVNTSGAITAAKDLTVNGLTIGRGGGNSNDQNTAIGTSSLNVNTSGNRNTAIGYNSLAENQAGGSNTASGSNSLQANQTGMYNTASGTNSLLRNTAGNFNTAFGFSAGESDNSGYNTTSDYSVYLGSNTRASIDGAQNEVVIGFNAIGAGSNTIQLGNIAITKVNTRGTVWSNGTQLSSDLRLKTNIQPLLNSIDLIMKLNPVHYDKKNSIESSDYAKTENGFIAQELQKVLPYLVSEGTDQDKILSVDYNSIIPVLTKGIQEQQLVINALQNQIDELKLILEKLLNEKK